MAKMPATKELLDSNPSVDGKKLTELQEMLAKLREARGKRKGYGLASPVTRRRIVVGDAARTDPRTVQLRAKR